jgi:hypothetical protein
MDYRSESSCIELKKMNLISKIIGAIAAGVQAVGTAVERLCMRALSMRVAFGLVILDLSN